MRVAVPLFGNAVAPRFGFADEFLFADVAAGSVSGTERITLSARGWHGRLAELSGRGVAVLLCAGFNRQFEPLAESFGIQVIAGLGGEADALVLAYSRGEELPVICRRRFGRRGAGRGRGRCGRRT